MKKILLSVLAVAAVAVSCQTEKLEEGTSQTGKTVKIVAELPETKTIFNPEDKTVAWEDGDELTVVVNSSSAYKFGKVAGENAFSALGVTLQDGQNTYHVLYPYNSYVKTVDVDGVTCNASGSKTYVDVPSEAATVQKGINNADHVKGVIYGYTTAADSETPSVQMHQLTALLKIDVTNNHTEPIEVRSITVSTDAAGQLLSGTYYINLETGETESSGDKYTYNYTTLGVTNVTMEAGATGTFWVSAHPFSVPQGSKLTISVETDKGVSSDERTYESALEFAEGTVNTASFNFEAPEAIEKLTVAEFLAKEVGNVYYELTGTISNISNTEYGNFDLTDVTGTVYVHGLTATKATSNDKSFSSLGLREGDVLTLVGTRAEYNGTAQVGGPAYYISHVAVPYCDVTPSTLSVGAAAGETTFSIESNESWSIESDNSSYTVSPASGNGDAEITVTYPANETSDAITVTFTVTSESGEKTVTLEQLAVGEAVLEIVLNTDEQPCADFPNTSAGETTTKAYTINGYEWTFSPSSGNKFSWYDDGYILWGKQGGYILLPSVPDKHLSKVTILTGKNASTSVKVGVYTEDGTSSVSGGSEITLNAKNTEFSWSLTGTEDGAKYQLRVCSNHNAQLQKLTLEYR